MMKEKKIRKIIRLSKMDSPFLRLSERLSWNLDDEPTMENLRAHEDGDLMDIDELGPEVAIALNLPMTEPVIEITYTIDGYGDLPRVTREYESDNGFSLMQILRIIYNFYQEKLTPDQLYMYLGGDMDHEINWAKENNSTISRVDMVRGNVFFEGLSMIDGSYYASFGN